MTSKPSPVNKNSNIIVLSLEKVTTFFAIVSGILLMLMALIVCVAVVMRYFFSLSVGWSTEIAEYFIYLAVVTAAPWVLRLDKHVRVDAVVSMLKPKTQQMLEVINNVLGCIMCGVLFYYGVVATHKNFVEGIMTIRVMPIPRYLPLLFIPIMAFLCFFQFSIKLKASLILWKSSMENDTKENAQKI